MNNLELPLKNDRRWYLRTLGLVSTNRDLKLSLVASLQAVSFYKLFNISRPRAPHLKKRRRISTQVIEILQILESLCMEEGRFLSSARTHSNQGSLGDARLLV